MKKGDIKLVNLDDSHYELILKIWRDADLPVCEVWRDSKLELERQLKSGNVVVYGAKVEDRVVGVVLNSDDSRKGWINHLAVIPEYRKQGIASFLIAESEKYFKNKGIKIIAALIEGHNNSSLNLFEKIGYIEFKGVKYVTKRESPKV